MESDQASKFYQKFEDESDRMKSIVLDAVVASSKCMYIDAMTILASDNGILVSSSPQSEKNRQVLRKRRA